MYLEVSVILRVVCVCYFVFLCIVLPLPPGTNPFAVNNHNNNGKSHLPYRVPKLGAQQK
jgi:hypothetical protein